MAMLKLFKHTKRAVCAYVLNTNVMLFNMDLVSATDLNKSVVWCDLQKHNVCALCPKQDLQVYDHDSKA